MQIKKWMAIALFAMLALCELSAQPLNEIGFGTMIAESGFADFNTSLDKDGWGMQVFLNGCKQNLPYLNITRNPNARYYGMVKVSLAEKWEIALKQPKKNNISLVKLHVRLFLFDVAEQREILRETVTTYSGVGKLVGVPGNVVLLKRAFEDALTLVTHKVAQRLPLLGMVRKVESTEITVALGEKHGINKFSVFEVLGKDGDSLGRFKVTKVMPDECRAVAEGEINSAVSAGLNARLLLPSPQVAQEKRVSVLGVLRKMRGNEIITDLGANRGINNSSTLEVLGDNGEVVAQFRVVLTTPGESKAVLASGNVAALRIGLVVRLVQADAMQSQEENYLSVNFGQSQPVILQKKTPIPLTMRRDDLGFSEDEDDTPPVEPVVKPKEPVKQPQPKQTTPADLTVDDNSTPDSVAVLTVRFAYIERSKLERAYQAVKKLEGKNVLKIVDVKQPNVRNMTLRVSYAKSQRELWDELKRLFQWETIPLYCQLKDGEIVVTEQ